MNRYGFGSIGYKYGAQGGPFAAGYRSVLGETYPDGRSASFEYDTAGRLAARTDAGGGRTSFAYDTAGRLSAETDPKGNRTLYAYDAAGRLITVTDAEGGVWDYTYTAAGLLASIKDAKTNITSFGYDLRNRLTAITDPLSNATHFEYDLAGRRIKMTKPTGEAVEYAYDAGDRITNIKSGAVQNLFTWSPDDLLLTAGSSFAWEYDAGHRLTKTLYKDLAKNIQFAYDAAGNRTKITREDLNAISYEYDALNRLAAVVEAGRRFSFAYDPAGRMTGRVYPNGVTSSYSYDTGGRLEKLEHRKGDGALLTSFAYAYDANSNRTSMTDNLGTRQYNYDRLNRLTKAAYASGRTQEFTYDPVGNRTKLTEEWPEILGRINKAGGTLSGGKLLKTVDYAYDAADHILTAGNKSYTHDTAGRLTKVTDNTGDTLFDYDMFDRPLRIAYPAAANLPSSVYTYASMLPDLRFNPAPMGLRASKSDAVGSNWQILDDNGNLLTEPGKRYVHAGLDTPLSLWEGTRLYYYLPDGLGSTAMLTDKYGDPVQFYDYEAYGKPNVTAADKNTIKYTGREYDPDAKLQYNRARYYDPDLGRWITPDPLAYAITSRFYDNRLGLPQQLNKCSYAGNNPIAYTDPLGLFRFDSAVCGSMNQALQNGAKMVENAKCNAYLSKFFQSALGVTLNDFQKIFTAGEEPNVVFPEFSGSKWGEFDTAHPNQIAISKRFLTAPNSASPFIALTIVHELAHYALYKSNTEKFIQGFPSGIIVKTAKGDRFVHSQNYGKYEKYPENMEGYAAEAAAYPDLFDAQSFSRGFSR